MPTISNFHCVEGETVKAGDRMGSGLPLSVHPALPRAAAALQESQAVPALHCYAWCTVPASYLEVQQVVVQLTLCCYLSALWFSLTAGNF